jgi:hypothetical protein
MYTWFSGLPCHFCSCGLLFGLQHLRHVVFWVVRVWTLGRVGTKFPSILCKCLRHKTCCVKFCIFFWKECFRLGTCHKVLITVSGACELSEWHFLFLPLCNKPTIMNLLESHTSHSRNLMGWGYDCGILLWDCNVMPFHIVFWGRCGGTSVHDHFYC